MSQPPDDELILLEDGEDSPLPQVAAPLPELDRVETRENLLATLERAMEYRSPGIGEHNQRVGHLAALIAQSMGLSEHDVDLIRQAAPLHDIGSIYIPERILNKRSKLLPEEFEVIKTHVGIGDKLLFYGRSDVLKMARDIVRGHHERYDGSGYPHGLRGLAIPLPAMITAVADVFDTLIHDQPYRSAWTVAAAVKEISSQSGVLFDPQVVAAFEKIIEDKSWLQETDLEDTRSVLLRGKLPPRSLLDLMTSLVAQRQSGIFFIHVGYLEAISLLYEGELIHARFDGQKGDAALQMAFSKMNTRDYSKFTLEAWEGPPPAKSLHTINLATKVLLKDLGRRLTQPGADVVRTG